MNDFTRGMQFGLQMAVEEERNLQKSAAFFLSYEEYKGYKKGVLEYKKKLEELRDAEV